MTWTPLERARLVAVGSWMADDFVPDPPVMCERDCTYRNYGDGLVVTSRAELSSTRAADYWLSVRDEELARFDAARRAGVPVETLLALHDRVEAARDPAPFFARLRAALHQPERDQ